MSGRKLALCPSNYRIKMVDRMLGVIQNHHQQTVAVSVHHEVDWQLQLQLHRFKSCVQLVENEDVAFQLFISNFLCIPLNQFSIPFVLKITPHFFTIACELLAFRNHFPFV